MRRTLHLLLILATLWRGVVGDAMAAQRPPVPESAGAVQVASALPHVVGMPCHEEEAGRASETADEAALSQDCGNCAACAVCHLGAIPPVPLAVAVLPRAQLMKAAPAPQWRSATLALAVKPPIS